MNVTTIQLNNAEVITGATLYFGQLDNVETFVIGITLHSNMRTYGHVGGVSSEAVVVHGYNLQYIAGRSGGLIDNLAFRFALC